MDTTADSYEGPSRRRGLDPLLSAALVATLVIHAVAVVAVARSARAPKEEEGPQINVMVTKLVRKGKPRDKKLLPTKVAPPPPQVEVKAPIVTENTQAAPAKKEKPKPKDAEPKKNLKDILRERMQKLRSRSNQPPINTEPEGSPTGSDKGTADTASEGDPCATAIHNAVSDKYKLPETIPESVAKRLTARVQVRIGKNGAMTAPKLLPPKSGNGLFDDVVLSAIEQAGRDAEARKAIAKECAGKLPFRPTLRFSGKDLGKN